MVSKVKVLGSGFNGVKGGKGFKGLAKALGGLKNRKPMTRGELRDYIKVFLGIDVPDKSMCEGHCSPMDYLWYSYSRDLAGGGGGGDAIVWANRSGSKTMLAAVATLMDCLFKAGCEVRILAGSMSQSGRMYEYLRKFINEGFSDAVDGAVLKERCGFVNGSRVELLCQSGKSVRGRHVHKLRCDEVELFDEDVFNAAKFITQSSGGINAGMEMISTMHRPYGLMNRLVKGADDAGVPVFKWCMWEVIERCEGRSCSRCALWSYCGGRAKDANGYLRIDDCIGQMRRSSRAGFEAEMLCMRPSRDDAVFEMFDEGEHVRCVDYDAHLPLYRAIDFGYVNPFVCLWLQVDGAGVVRVIDEYVRTRATVGENTAAVIGRTPCGEDAVAGTFCDPAGAGRDDVSGSSAVREMRRMGVRVRYRRSGIVEGLELIRAALRDAAGRSGLVIDPRCERLIESMKCYHYAAENEAGAAEVPVKDGVYDHSIDALRYFFVNYKRSGRLRVIDY
jgi:hypothetical protein